MDYVEPLPQALPVFTDSMVSIDVGESLLNALLSANNAPMGVVSILVVLLAYRFLRRKARKE